MCRPFTRSHFVSNKLVGKFIVSDSRQWTREEVQVFVEKFLTEHSYIQRDETVQVGKTCDFMVSKKRMEDNGV